MKNLTWQNPEQLFVAQELINKVKSKCCGIKEYMDLYNYFGKVGSLNRLIIILDIVIIGLSSESYIGIAPWVIIYITYVALFKNRQYESRNSNVFSIP